MSIAVETPTTPAFFVPEIRDFVGERVGTTLLDEMLRADPLIYVHCLRTAHIFGRVAVQTTLNSQLVETGKLSAALHDISKATVGSFNAIANSPDAFTPTTRRIMSNHAPHAGVRLWRLSREAQRDDPVRAATLNSISGPVLRHHSFEYILFNRMGHTSEELGTLAVTAGLQIIDTVDAVYSTAERAYLDARGRKEGVITPEAKVQFNLDRQYGTSQHDELPYWGVSPRQLASLAQEQRIALMPSTLD